MKPEQWFTLWITIISVVGGCIAAIISVWAGAALALRGNRRSLRHERARAAAERCLTVIDRAAEEYRLMRPSLSRDPGAADIPIDERTIEQVMTAYDNFVESEIGHEAWLLENETITFAIADCLHQSMQLHLDSFGIGEGELHTRLDGLYSRLVAVGDMLRAATLDKRVSELTDRDRYVSAMLLPGRHIEKKS
jgi:hypothetical protein